MAKSLFIVLLLLLFVYAGLRLHGGVNRQVVPTDPAPFIPISAESKKRFFDPSRKPADINGYPQTVYSVLHAASDDDLVGISCSSAFIRNWESLFFLQNETTLKYTISLPHDRMLRWMTELELTLPNAFGNEKKFLLGRLCRVPDGTWFFEYHRGVQPQFYDNYLSLGKEINSYLFIAKDDTSFQTTIDLTGESRGPIFHCMPMQMTKKGLLYYQCTEVKNGDATTWFYEIDINTGQSREVDACVYRYGGKPTRQCEPEA